jgi:hypothetical protein
VASSQLQICQQTASGGFVVLAPVAFSLTANTFYNMRFRALGQSLYGKIWIDGTTEPTAWTVTATTTVLTSGQVGLAVALGVGSHTVSFDHFNASNATLSGLLGNVTKDLVMRAGIQTTAGTQQKDLAMRARLVDLSTSNITVTTYAAKRKPLERRFPKS